MIALQNKTLTRDFYNKSTIELAKSLLGKILVHESSEGTTSGMIVEAEAYCGVNDRAAHTYRGRTKRTEILFGEPGFAYIFTIYGIHQCFSMSAEREGIGQTVLIRALEPIDGISLMKKRRGKDDIYQLTNAPSKLCQAMNIDKRYYGHDLKDEPLYITNGITIFEHEIKCGKRIGIDGAGEDKNKPWRFWIDENRFVSRKSS